MHKTADFHSNLLISWELVTEGYQGRPFPGMLVVWLFFPDHRTLKFKVNCNPTNKNIWPNSNTVDIKSPVLFQLDFIFIRLTFISSCLSS